MEPVSDNSVRLEASVVGNGGVGPVNGEDVTSKIKSTPRNDNNNSCTYPMVTGEKMTTESSDSKKAGRHYHYASSFIVTCPDGSVVQLSAPLSDGTQDSTKNDGKNNVSVSSQIIIGRGKYGIPSSASHVSRQACVLRMVLDDDAKASATATATATDSTSDNYLLELVVLGSQPCRITRQPSTSEEADGEKISNTIFAKSISQIIAENGNNFSSSSMKICHGDVIEPCERPTEYTLDEAMEKGCYHPFTVHFTTNIVIAEEITDTVTLFSEANRKIEAAAAQLDETKKTVEEHDGTKESSQNTVAVKVTMKSEKKVEMEVPKNLGDDGKDEKAATLTSPKNLGDDGNDEKAVTLTSIICGSMGTPDSTVKLDKPMDNDSSETEAIMDCSSVHNANKEGEEGGSVKAGNLNLPTDPSEGENESTKASSLNPPTDTAPTTSATEPLKESPASLNRDIAPSSSSDDSSGDEYEFDDPRQEIIDILQEIDSPGTFAVGGSCDGKLIMPGLVVDGIGPIGLPLSKTQAKELANRCEQAPFGRGAQTIVDTSIRNTFQLAPDSFQITNPAWKNDLATITKSVCQDLGVQYNLKVEAQLYKLLLYEEGSFFAPHRDSEKEEGMFGTLVIVLPSQFTGGELVVKHKGETQIFKQEGLSSFSSQYAAFYADCKHELKKVTSGHRLCIVFNLVKCGLGQLPKVADNRSIIKRLNSAASQWAAAYDGKKIVLMTDHLYTPAGIRNGTGSSKYKGADAYVVELLQSAISKGGDIDYDHGTLSLSESGYGECDGYGYWGRGEYTWGEATERDLSLVLSSHGYIGVDEEEEVIPEDFFQDLEPEDESFEPTGNAGIQAERQYADTEAIVVWPRSKRWAIVTNNDTSRMCSYLLKACSKGTPDSEPKDECLQKAKSLIPRVIGSYNASNASALVKSITLIGDESLAKEFLSSYLKSEERSIDAIFDHLQTFSDLCGAEAITALIVDSINTTRLIADPTGTANFVLKYLNSFGKKVATPQQQKDTVIAAFAASTRPPTKSDPRPLKTSLDKFPLNAILALFVDGKPENGTLARSILEGYVWISCKEVKNPNYYYSSSTKPSDGPVLVTSASRSIIQLCDVHGWAEYKNVLVDAVEKLCERGKSDIALSFVNSITPVLLITPKDEDKSDRSDICSQLAAVAYDKMLASLQAPSTINSTKQLEVCKKLVVGIGRFCSSKAPQFVEVAKSLDVDSVLFPLVSDPMLRSNTCDSVTSSLNLLTSQCANILNARLSTDFGGSDSVAIWSLPNASISKNSRYSSFIQSPCRQVYDWQVRKADHAGFIEDLKALIRAGEVKTESYQPRGRGAYHFKITKLKSRRVPSSSLVGLECTCSSSPRYSSYSQNTTPTNCLLSKPKALAAKYQEDLKKMNAIKSLVPSAPAVATATKSQRPEARRPELQQFCVLYSTSKLGLKPKFVNGKDILVEEVTSTPPSNSAAFAQYSNASAHLIKAGDFIVGLNGKRFEELDIRVTGTESYQQALSMLKEAKRPMSVMFERHITTNIGEATTRKRPAVVAVVGGENSVAGVDAQSQHPAAKKAKAAEVIDLT